MARMLLATSRSRFLKSDAAVTTVEQVTQPRIPLKRSLFSDMNVAPASRSSAIAVRLSLA